MDLSLIREITKIKKCHKSESRGVLEFAIGYIFHTIEIIRYFTPKFCALYIGSP